MRNTFHILTGRRITLSLAIFHLLGISLLSAETLRVFAPDGSKCILIESSETEVVLSYQETKSGESPLQQLWKTSYTDNNRVDCDISWSTDSANFAIIERYKKAAEITFYSCKGNTAESSITFPQSAQVDQISKQLKTVKRPGVSNLSVEAYQLRIIWLEHSNVKIQDYGITRSGSGEPLGFTFDFILNFTTKQAKLDSWKVSN